MSTRMPRIKKPISAKCSLLTAYRPRGLPKSSCVPTCSISAVSDSSINTNIQPFALSGGQVKTTHQPPSMSAGHPLTKRPDTVGEPCLQSSDPPCRTEGSQYCQARSPSQGSRPLSKLGHLGSVAEKGEMTVRQANWCQCSRWKSGRRGAARLK